MTVFLGQKKPDIFGFVQVILKYVNIRNNISTFNFNCMHKKVIKYTHTPNNSDTNNSEPKSKRKSAGG